MESSSHFKKMSISMDVVAWCACGLCKLIKDKLGR